MKDPRVVDETRFEKIRHWRKRGNRREGTPGSLPRCNGKQTYSKKRANRVRDVQLKFVPYLRVYRCPTCFHWHLTHRKPR